MMVIHLFFVMFKGDIHRKRCDFFFEFLVVSVSPFSWCSICVGFHDLFRGLSYIFYQLSKKLTR